ncbi:hypothetical protein [Terrabacter sp. 2RAF25]|uniref:hypothetical protein n=1 Tax=Terrabacter sp. 2RAF25 TaxID=3232998 RepID=UPI003F947523
MGQGRTDRRHTRSALEEVECGCKLRDVDEIRAQGRIGRDQGIHRAAEDAGLDDRHGDRDACTLRTGRGVEPVDGRVDRKPFPPARAAVLHASQVHDRQVGTPHRETDRQQTGVVARDSPAVEVGGQGACREQVAIDRVAGWSGGEPAPDQLMERAGTAEPSDVVGREAAGSKAGRVDDAVRAVGNEVHVDIVSASAVMTTDPPLPCGRPRAQATGV